MGLTMRTKREITKEIAPRYQKSREREKTKILDEFVGLTGYTRCYASWLLRNCGRKIVMKGKGGRRIIFVGEIRKRKRKRKRVYDEEVLKPLKRIWYIMDFPCGKRLRPSLKWIVPKLEQHGELRISKEVREKLLKISSATIDRLLRSEKRKMELKPKAKTKPGTLLKHQIPVRTFSDWDDKRPGFVEIDLVSHDGGNVRGDFIQTLDVTDVATGWTETEAVRNRAQVWVFEALKKIQKRLPFELLGIDSDNDTVFINAHLLRYCERNNLTFTRTRVYRKNDNCYVEQKNWTVVRRAVGYLRYDTEEELKTLNELYKWLRLYTNFFQPMMKLLEKRRVGSKVRKKYDEPRTPYQRVLESQWVNKENKEKLKSQYDKLNPVELKRKQELKRGCNKREYSLNSHINSYMRQ